MNIPNLETRKVWVAWTNTDNTEGRGERVPIAVCEYQTTAERLGKGKSVMASTDVSEADAVLFNGRWLGPVRFEKPTDNDRAVQSHNAKRNAAMVKARLAGMSDEEIQLIQQLP